MVDEIWLSEDLQELIENNLNVKATKKHFEEIEKLDSGLLLHITFSMDHGFILLNYSMCDDKFFENQFIE